VKEFSFDKGIIQFSQWGIGLSSHDPNIGFSKLGSQKISCDFGEHQTIYKHFTKLKKGTYEISFFVKLKDVQKGKYDVSFWHFIDRGNGTETIFKNLKGSFGWRKVKYNLKIKKELKIWLRLKSPGSIWIDDISIKRVSNKGDKEYSILKLKSKGVSRELVSVKQMIYLKKKTKTIYETKSSISTNEYLNISRSDLNVISIDGYDRIEVDVTNPSENQYQIYLVLKDRNSRNYWSQLNFKTHLSPGINYLSFNLNRNVGERGSSKLNRPLDLKEFTGMYLVIDPDLKSKRTNEEFKVGKIKLIKNKTFVKPKSLIALDFTSHKSKEIFPVKKVTSQDLYNKRKGLGFINPDFYKIYDAKSTSLINRYSIGILKGQFRVDIPNGTYKVKLNIDSLGYWDIPFWQRRNIQINSKFVYVESRNTASQFIKDYFRFENVEPSLSSSPYDLYLSKIFNPITKTVIVKNGYIIFDFEGDQSAINLNSMYLWPVSIDKKANEYLSNITLKEREEFEWNSRSLVDTTSSKMRSKKISFKFIDTDLDLVPNKNFEELVPVNFQGVSSEKVFKLLQINNSNAENIVQFSVKGITKESYEIKKILYQYSSSDMNHETYKMVGKIISPMSKTLLLKPNETRYILLEIDLSKIDQNKKLSAEIFIESKNDKTSNQFSVYSLDYKLPSVNLPVGYIGLDPFPKVHFKNENLNKFRHQLRLKALKEIVERGFTTFTGLPELTISSDGKVNKDSIYLDDLLKNASKLGISHIFSYGGLFPQTILNNSQKPYAFEQKEYDEIKLKILKKYFNNNKSPKLIHTFSDEAQGYSNNIKRDINSGIELKKKYPFILLGGFGEMGNKESAKLNALFDYGIYSSTTILDVKSFKKSKKTWGRYNGSVPSFSSPEFAFGLGLYFAHKAGLGLYLDWHLAAIHNYPYYELDGREIDSVMLYPRSNGDLYPSLKLELATKGLNTYRKLLLLDQLSSKIKSKTSNLYKKWISDSKSRYRLLDNHKYYQMRGDNLFKINKKAFKFLKDFKSNI